ncbi:MerR family transcriptional regulator [Peijinzhouia sedimentorum]
MPYKEKEIEKKYYTIGEVAAMFKVATSMIRFWESEFDIIKPGKNKKGNRVFTKKDVESVKLVYHLVKEKGYTLQGAREFIKNSQQEGTITDNVAMINSLRNIRSFLVELQESLP